MQFVQKTDGIVLECGAQHIGGLVILALVDVDVRQKKPTLRRRVEGVGNGKGKKRPIWGGTKNGTDLEVSGQTWPDHTLNHVF